MGKGGGLAGTIALLFLLAVVAGCGGSSAGGETETKPSRMYPRVHGASREFLLPDGDNAVQFFGKEASPAEREEASRVVHSWMRARVAEDWKAACRYLSAAYTKTLTEDANSVSGGKATTCTQTLAFFGDQASGTSGNTLTGPIDSLRVRGNRAFAQWHGPHQIDWVLPMHIEDGAWRVESASPVERTK
jgi:hypothetical protein